MRGVSDLMPLVTGRHLSAQLENKSQVYEVTLVVRF